MATDDNATSPPQPSTVDLLFDVPNARDPAAPSKGVDSRLRIGSARSNKSPTATDADFVQQVLKTVPEAQRPSFSGDVTTLPAVADANADIKRSLRYDGPTGFGIVTNGQLSKYLGGNEVSRILDGSFRVYAVDQSGTAPQLSYLRLGKAEPQLGIDDQGDPVEGSGTPLTRDQDPAMDAKYNGGIGAYTQGRIDAYAKGEIGFQAEAPLRIKSKGFVQSSIGTYKNINYDTETKPGTTKISSAEWRFDMPDGNFKQTYERARKLGFSVSNSGSIGISMSYGLALGLSFDHKYSTGMSTGYSATVEVKGESKIKVTPNGFESDTLIGKFSIAKKVELAGNESVEISCARLNDVGMMATMKVFQGVVSKAVAAQNGIFLAWEASLARRADMNTIQIGQESNIDSMGEFGEMFKNGPGIYKAALGLSATTCAAGILLAAVQAANSKVPDPGFTPKISMTPFDMTISAGIGSKITINQLGIVFKSPKTSIQSLVVSVASANTSFAIR